MLIEISPDHELPTSIPISGVGENCPEVVIGYDWIRDICSYCKVFGHDSNECTVEHIVTDKQDSDHYRGNMVSKVQPKNTKRSINKKQPISKTKIWRQKEISCKNNDGKIMQQNGNDIIHCT